MPSDTQVSGCQNTKSSQEDYYALWRTNQSTLTSVMDKRFRAQNAHPRSPLHCMERDTVSQAEGW